jgi:hypothetical protein
MDNPQTFKIIPGADTVIVLTHALTGFAAVKKLEEQPAIHDTKDEKQVPTKIASPVRLTVSKELAEAI